MESTALATSPVEECVSEATLPPFWRVTPQSRASSGGTVHLNDYNSIANMKVKPFAEKLLAAFNI